LTELIDEAIEALIEKRVEDAKDTMYDRVKDMLERHDEDDAVELLYDHRKEILGR